MSRVEEIVAAVGEDNPLPFVAPLNALSEKFLTAEEAPHWFQCNRLCDLAYNRKETEEIP